MKIQSKSMAPAGLALALAAAPAAAQDFWKHWGDGKAELNGYRIEQPRYGAVRAGTAVLIFVTEDFDDAARVKHEGRGEPQGPVFPVLKLNHVRDFQTGIYDYNVMTSVFLRVRRGWPVRKVSFSSQEWCGHVWEQLVPGDGGVADTWHSYFQGEADGERRLELPEGAVFGDAVPLLIRDWTGEWVAPGESRAVPWLPTLMEARFQHRPVAWGRATVSRAASSVEVTVPAGTFTVEEWTVAVDGGPETVWRVEAEAPFRIVSWSGDDGERGELLGSTRLPYWELNGPGGAARLEEMGLR